MSQVTDEDKALTERVISAYMDFGGTRKQAEKIIAEAREKWQRDAARSIVLANCEITTRDGDTWLSDLTAGRPAVIDGYSIVPIEAAQPQPSDLVPEAADPTERRDASPFPPAPKDDDPSSLQTSFVHTGKSLKMFIAMQRLAGCIEPHSNIQRREVYTAISNLIDEVLAAARQGSGE